MENMLYLIIGLAFVTLMWIYGLNLEGYLRRDFDGLVGSRAHFHNTGHRIEFLGMYFGYYLIAVVIIGMVIFTVIPLGSRIVSNDYIMVAGMYLANGLLIVLFIWEQAQIRMLPIKKDHVDMVAARFVHLRAKYQFINDTSQMLMIVNFSYIMITMVKLFPIVYPPTV